MRQRFGFRMRTDGAGGDDQRPTVALMIGIAVGSDHAPFIVTRHQPVVATDELVYRLRTGVLSLIEVETAADVVVTGDTAVRIGAADTTANALPGSRSSSSA